MSAGTLAGPGTLNVTGSLSTSGSSVEMSGTGKTVLKSGATAEVKQGGAFYLYERTLVNEGTLTFSGGGYIYAYHGALIENSGTFKANSEPISGAAFRFGSGAAPLLVNTGHFEKTSGSGNTDVEVKFENKGAVEAQSGALRFINGGSSSGTNSWTAAEGKKIVFWGGTFSMGSSTTFSGALEFNGGTTTATNGLHDPEAKITVGSGTLNVNGGPLEAGTLSQSGGTVNLGSAAEASTVSTLAMSAGTLAGPGTLNVTGSLSTSGSSVEMSGTGKTVLKSGATAEVKQGGAFYLYERTLVNEGTLTFSGGGYIYAYHGALIENSGTFKANSEPISGAAFRFGSGAAPLLVNTGHFEKTSGSGNTDVEVKFENKGAVEAQSGALRFINGGSSSGTNSWTAAEGKKIVFWGGTFSMGSSTTFSGALEFNGGTTTATNGLHDPEAKITVGSGTLNVNGGPLEAGTLSQSGGTVNLGSAAEASTVSTLAMSAGTLAGPGTLNVTGSLSTSGSSVEMSGTGKTVLKSGATAEVKQGGAFYLYERTLVNEGTLTFSGGGYIYAYHGALIENSGTFKANSEPISGAAFRFGSGAAPLLVNTGHFEKTSGSGNTDVEVNFSNLGQIKEQTGHLRILHPVAASYKQQFGKHCHSGDPVECATGNYTETQTDFAIGGLGVGLDLTRSYSAQAAASAGSPGAFGYGWSNSFGDRLVSEESGKKVTLLTASGSAIPFTGGPGTFSAPTWSQDKLSGSAEAGYTLTLPKQTKYAFNGSGRLESVSDRNGNKTTLAYDEAGRLKMITDPASRAITLFYNGEGLVEKAEDPMGHVVKYAYESQNLKSVTEPGEAGPRWQFKYDASHRITSVTDGRGGKTTNEYDGSSRVISQTDPAGHTIEFEFAPFHTKVTNKATGSVTDEWFTSNNEPFSITRGYGTADATTETFAYNAAGRLTSRTDGNGHTTTYGYDGAGNRTSERNAAGEERKWTFNEAHQVLTETKPSGEKTTIVRDANGNPETVSRPAPESKTQTVSYEYGTHGEVKAMTDPLGNTWSYECDSHGDLKAEIDPEGDKRSWTYDEDSRVISAISPRGNEEGAEAAKFTTSIERDAQERPLKITDPLEGTTKYAYDADGNVETITDPNGRKTKFTYDADNERTKVERPNGAVEETGYDGAGQITSQTDGNKQKTTYVRNVLEQPVEVVDPLERKTITTFDAAGNLKTKKDPDGRTTTYGYDNADRLKEISYSDGITPQATFGYDKNGNLTSMIDGSGESTYEYDQLDRLIRSKNGNGDTVSWEYNLGNEPIDLTYPNGKSIARLYDKAGRLESVTDWLGHTTSFAYNKDSELKATTFPSGTSNLDEYAFDRADRMSGVTMKKGAETLASLSYARDKAGQVESLLSKGLPGAEEESFAYDENERLKTAGASSYEYDSANNLTKAPGTTNAFDKASQLESATGANFSYDKEGERTKRTPFSGPATTYKYDQAGNLTAVERSEEGETPAIAESFAYDGTGLLASRTVGLSTQHLAWDSSEELPLLLSDGENSYLYGPNGLAIEQISSGEAPTYLHHDQLGSTRLMTNSSGEVAGTTTFAPYGAVAGKTGSATTPLGFAGQYTLGQSGLQYLRARFYDPATAQFLTVDPLLEGTRAPYFYAGGNPLSYFDRSGLEAELEFPCIWPFCSPPPPVVEPLEEAATSLNDVANSLFGGSEEIAGSVTIAPWVLEARSSESSGGDESSECERNPQQDKRVTERELEEAGLDPHELKELGSGSDIYKDREGNLYEKPHGGRGPGESLGINIKDRFK